jgi:hypothetical protein
LTYGLKERPGTPVKHNLPGELGSGDVGSDATEHSGPPEVGQSNEASDLDAVDRALAAALSEATAAGQWAVASRILAELERRSGAGSADVVDLAAARGRRQS